MKLIVKADSNQQKEIPPSGTFIARCIQIIDLGTQEDEYQGQTKHLRKILIMWELPTEVKVFDEKKGEQPFVISKQFTLSLGDKANLRKVLESWRGKGFTDEELKGFDIEKLLDKPCMLSIIHKQSKSTGNNYATITGVSEVPKGLKCDKRVNPLVSFSLQETFDKKVFDELYEWQQKLIKDSPEYQELMNPSQKEITADDLIGTDEPPF